MGSRGIDPLANAAPLIRRVYAYVAYRVGHGAEAEDLTSETFERACRYRSSFDSSLGAPLPWLLGIARRCIAARGADHAQSLEGVDVAALTNVEEQVIGRLDIRVAMSSLSRRDRELLALRYGADLTTREIAAVLELSHAAVRVALHRALERLRYQLDGEVEAVRAPLRAALVAPEEAT